MSVILHRIIYCDECKTIFTNNIDIPIIEQRKTEKLRGWKMEDVDGFIYDLCPVCNNKKQIKEYSQNYFAD